MDWKASERKLVAFLEKVAPRKRVERQWISGEPNLQPEKPAPPPILDAARVARSRVLRVMAAALLLTDIGFAVMLYSDVWYLNLILYAYLVPNMLVLLHYIGVTRNS